MHKYTCPVFTAQYVGWFSTAPPECHCDDKSDVKDVCVICFYDIKKLKEENEKLKAENELLKHHKMWMLKREDSFKNEIEQLKAQLQKTDKCKDCGGSIYCNDCMDRTLQECTKNIGWSANQNRDKASQVERKQCAQCDSVNAEIGNYCEECRMKEAYSRISQVQSERKPHKCPACNNGIVRTLCNINSLCFHHKDELGFCKKTCSPCKGTGIVWEPK